MMFCPHCGSEITREDRDRQDREMFFASFDPSVDPKLAPALQAMMHCLLVENGYVTRNALTEVMRACSDLKRKEAMKLIRQAVKYGVLSQDADKNVKVNWA